ncbi:NfeD family protein [Rikenella microfusus]|uniref:NfeD-like C-terminal, partner-binding n=1 Tax=Rikenella microfusus TaxID=28139 RepID=A0A379MUI3_9BACT|nr:NfeD family protein [Rikenella microfusus]SUE34292.1 NfeD-like C-terminal, partner-binding [Rikenella microfusus]
MTLWITLLILLGVLLFIAELVLLPGLTLAALGSFCCLVGAVTWAFVEGGTAAGFITLGIVVVLLLILTALFLRPRTWNRFTLKTNIESRVQPLEIETQVEVGVQGTTLTRLAPMGKVQIGGRTFEAKSLDSYIDPRRQVTVIGYDNASIVVRPVTEA